MGMRIIALLIVVAATTVQLHAQGMTVTGTVTEEETGKPIEFASLLLKDHSLWAISDEKGFFAIKNVPQGKTSLVVQCLGYVKTEVILDVAHGMDDVAIRLKVDNLSLDEVEVVAHRKTDTGTTSYVIDRNTLDNQQIIDVSNIQTLLPGGKSVNGTLMSDIRLALRSASGEKGNASFGTAVEIDGARLGNNMEVGETMAAGTRTISTSDIESVEVVTGIASVEHGDLSNGVVRIHTRKGKSPFIVEENSTSIRIKSHSTRDLTLDNAQVFSICLWSMHSRSPTSPRHTPPTSATLSRHII